MAIKSFKDPFANIRASQEKREKELLIQTKKPTPSKPATSVGEFRLLDEESKKQTIPDYHPPENVFGTIKRTVLGAGGIGTLEGIESLREKAGTRKMDNIGMELGIPGATGYKPLITPEGTEELEDRFKLRGTLAEDIWRGVGHETPAIIASYGTIGAATKIPAIGKALTGAGKWTETGRRGVAAGALYTPIANDDPELRDYLENMALFGIGDVAFMGAAHGIGKGISKGLESVKGKMAKAPTITEKSSSLDYLLEGGSEPSSTLAKAGDTLSQESKSEFAPWVKEDLIDNFNKQRGEEVKEFYTTYRNPFESMYENQFTQPWPDYVPPQGIVPDFTAGVHGVYRGAPRLELAGSAERLALPGNAERLSLPSSERKALPSGQDFVFSEGYPLEGYWFVDPYGVARREPGAPLALPEGKTGTTTPYVFQDESFISRSDIGDPAYLADLTKRYYELIDAEIQRLKSEIGGVITIPGTEGGYIRQSQNPPWYQEWWRKNMRAPRAGEWRDLAIKNLVEGNSDLGYPPDEEFLSIISELSRGQKLPEEWHGLTRSIMEMDRLQEPELEPLINDMIIERGNVEPYGLTRDLGRLNETENFVRNRSNMLDEADFGRYERIRFKNNADINYQIPDKATMDEAGSKYGFKWSEMTDSANKPYLAKEGSNKILYDGLTDYDSWATSMVRDYGEGVTPRLNELWQKANKLSEIYRKRDEQILADINRTRKDYVTTEQPPSDIIYKAPTSQERQRAYDKWAGKSTGPEDNLSREAGDNLHSISRGKRGGRGISEHERTFTRREQIEKAPDFHFKNKLSSESQLDLEILQEVMTKRIGPFRIGKVDLAPEAFKRPDFKAANEIAAKLGLRLVPFKGTGHRGMQTGRTIYLNKDMKDPLDYVFWHEVGHSMERTHPEHYERLMDISLAHIKDTKGLQKHYEMFNYDREDIPHEFTADVFAEALSTPGFFARVAENAPELIKPLLEAIDNLIANIKGMISKDDTILPYLKDLDALRNKIREEVAGPYFKDAMGEKEFVDTFGKQWTAAKAKGGRIEPASTDTLEFRKWFEGSKVVDEQGRPLVVYHNTSADFNAFDVSKARQSQDIPGIFFSDSPTEWADMGDRQIQAYLSIKNPYTGDYTTYKGIRGGSTDTAFREIRDALIKDGYDGIITRDGDTTEYIAFFPGQIKSVYNRGTWDATNPDIRYKLGQDRSPIEDLKAMIEYGANQLHKGGYKYFVSDLSKQFPDIFEGYSSEVTDRLMKDVWLRAKELKETGVTQIEMGGQAIPITKVKSSGRYDIRNRARDAVAGESDFKDIDTRKHIVSKTQGEPIIAKEVAKNFYINAVDNLYRIDELDKFVAKTTGKHLPAEDKAYLLAINSRESTGAAKAILEENLVDAKGNIIGPSFKEVLSNIPRGKEQEFKDYLILRNAISWMEQGKQVYPQKWGMTPEKVIQRLAEYDSKIPELKKAADEYVAWHRDMAKAWLVDTGIISPEMWQSFIVAHPYYTPFQRQMKSIEIAGGQGKARGGFANQTNPTKKAEGSERPIIDPIESTIEQVERYIKTAKRNEVMQAIIRNLEKTPEDLIDFAEIIPQKGLDALDNINTVFEKDGVDGILNYLDEPFELMKARIAKSEQTLNRPNIVRAFVNGERVHVKVNDPVLLDALTNLSDTGSNAIVESFRTVTRIMKILTTGSNPIFAARNIARDVPMAYVASETLSKTPVVREVQFTWGMIDALARILTNEKWHPDKFYREYKAMGGGSHTASVSADRNILAESKSRVMPGYWRPENNNPLSYAGKAAKAGFQGVERFTSTVEALPRLPEYIRTVKKGGNTYASRLEGLHASQDVTVNFSRRGNMVRDADAFIPYFNAAVQGIEKIARMFGKDPIGATYRSIVGVTVPTLTLYLLNKDNPNYHKLSNFIRDNYYCLPIQNGEKFIRIAKPREIGVVFSDLPERALRQWEADDPEGFYNFSEAWINNFVPPIRPIFAPFYDVLANKNFAGTPIVPGYMQGLSPELQYDDKTSMAARKIGEALNLSPKQIDYLFRSFTGVIGELGIPAMAEGKGQSAGQRVGEVLSRTFTSDPLYSNDVMTKFYEEKEKLDTAATDYKQTGQKSEYYNPREQRLYNRQAQRINNIRKEIRRVNSDPSLSYEEKEELTRRLQANMLEIAQRAVGDRFSPRTGMVSSR